MICTRISKGGFTLIELSIVLVIVGLIVGGVLAGRDIVAASQRRKLISEIADLKTSIFAFYGKYGCLPGDCARASSFFGNSAPNGTPIVNGNGNGLIDQFPYAPYSEVWQVAVQLSASGMKPGSYIGTNGPNGTRSAIPNLNVPSSAAYANIGYTFINWGGWTDSSDFTPPVASLATGNVLLIGSPDHDLYETYSPFLSPVDAMFVDQKIDDGKPASGRLIMLAPNLYPNCATSNNSTVAAWNIGFSGVACGFLYNVPTP